MRESNLIMDLVRRDVEVGLGEVLPPEGSDQGLSILDGFEFVHDEPIRDRSNRVEVVPWSWTGVHRRELLGLAPTGRTITVRGVTLVSGEERDEQLRRFVDWVEVLAELGVRFYERPVVDVRDRFGDEILEQVPGGRETMSGEDK